MSKSSDGQSSLGCECNTEFDGSVRLIPTTRTSVFNDTGFISIKSTGVVSPSAPRLGHPSGSARSSPTIMSNTQEASSSDGRIAVESVSPRVRRSSRTRLIALTRRQPADIAVIGTLDGVTRRSSPGKSGGDRRVLSVQVNLSVHQRRRYCIKFFQFVNCRE